MHKTPLQGELFDNRVVFGSVEQEALQRFWSMLGEREGAPSPVQVPGVILFPNISSSDLRRALPPGIRAAGREEVSSERLPAWIEAHLGAPLTRDQIDVLRAVFSPEVVIPATMTVRQPVRRDTSAGLTDYLLSPTQEWALKVDLELSDEAESANRDMGVWQVSGVAGSGKSLLIVYRARLLRQYFPQKRILVLTFNRPLIRDLEARYKRLTDDDTGVEWQTFHQWCLTHWPGDEGRPKIITERKRTAIIAEVLRQHLADTSISERMFHEEIDWFKGRSLNTLQDYLSADRSGRGFGLSEAMRHRVFVAMQAYTRRLETQGLIDWGDVPRRIRRALLENRVSFQPYDFILIDEAQFFAPIWFEIVKLILKPKGHLFVVADPTQGFLRRGESWKAVGLEVRGRSIRLDRSYRTSPAILDFASRMYQMRLPDDEEAIIPQAAPQAQSEPPQVIALDSEQDEITRVINEIRALCNRGVPLEHILVLHSDWQGVERMLERLRREFGNAAVADPKKIPPGKHLRVCTMNAATGLESPIVFVMGVHRLYEAEQDPRLSAEERAELIRSNTRQLYMAFTRAAQRLAITCVGDPPPFLLLSGSSSVYGREYARAS
ncbi:MAG: UvrD-helicase domain-containing protein [Roseiflexus sp.]|nr:UvrD-helicase domain-containing protein [Roseiflexus sp.]MCS7289137.1 UvrD-helicase domain-containing protein [Roseiflexus sp.]MDW8233153.1 UvrD-helicase domain-containing protein [Roseiflexaceae bacterium]